jgi:hypothetical protein
MTPKKSLWSAARLNAELAKSDGASLAFMPYGEVVRLNPSADQFEAPSAEVTKTRNESTPVADIAFLKMGRTEALHTNVSLMPPLLACLAIDPEPWSIFILHPKAVDVVGPFRDVSSPLRDWLLRALRLGYAIGAVNFLSGPSPSQIARSKGSGIFELLPEERTESPSLPRFPLPELVPTFEQSSTWLTTHLELFDARQLGGEVKSPDDAVALAAGLWQMNGFLERSHELAQSVEGGCRERAGDYWHAIMHRREPDYSNAKYWFQRVGTHGIHPFLARDADSILTACPSTETRLWQVKLTGNNATKWNSLAFVDLCEQVENSGDEELGLAARQIQLIEMVLLLKSTHHHTFG